MGYHTSMKHDENKTFCIAPWHDTHIIRDESFSDVFPELNTLLKMQ